MTEPAPADGGTTTHGGRTADPDRPGDPFAALATQPVAEHVAIFDSEHARLQRELGTIDQL